MTFRLLPTLLLAVPLAVLAQSRIILPPPRPFPPLPPVVIKLPEQTQAVPIQVAEASFSAHIAGVLAQTTATFRFYNPNDRVLEGELVFPLPANATVSGYALDINGKMIDGVIVEKEKARVVFDEITRQGIDPGLVEQTAGNTFRTRIYPLPARGSRTVTVSYVTTVDIVREGDARASYYIQPLRFPNKLDKFKLDLTVAAAQQPPKVAAGALSNLTFTNWQNVYTASTELKDIELTEDLAVAIMTRPEQSLAVQKTADGASWFAFHKLLDLQKLSTPAKPAARRPVILWDASLSRAKSDHTPELDFLKAVLADSHDITLIIFRNTPEKPAVFPDAAALLKALQTVVYDGATNLRDALAAIPDNAEAFLFSDGLDNLSDTTTPIAPASARLSAFFADKDQNLPFLRGLTARTGGICADLRTTAIDDARRLLDNPAIAVSAVAADGRDITPTVSWQLNGDRLAIAGPLPADAKTLTFTIKLGDTPQTLTLTVADAAIADGKLVKTFFGNLRIAQLIADNAPEDALTAAGKDFGLVTPTTSLLVLDSLEQYLRYSIRPPESLPELRKQYDARHQDDPKKNNDKFVLKPSDPAYIKRLWDALVSWHKRDFPTTGPAKPGVLKQLFGGAGNAAVANEEVVLEAVPAMAAPAGAAPVLAAPAMAAPAPRERAVRREAPRREPVMAAPAAEAMDIAAAPAAPEALHPQAQTALQPWKPDTPYLNELKQHADKPYDTYLKQRLTYGDAPGFYMDCADFFLEHNLKDLAVRILSNLAEIDLENKQLLRICAYKLRFHGELKTAETLFRKVLKIAREEPQSYRDLALTLDDEEKFQEAVDVMMTIVNHKWDDRFPEVEAIALTEINRFVARAKRRGITIKNVPENYLHLIDCDIRVVLNWDADMTDMDLWTTDSFNEKCFYSHRLTATGGHNSCDFTQGYGPEEFMIRNAVKGKYKIEANYYGSHSQKVIGPVTLYTEVFTNYGRPDETKRVLTYRLSTNKEVILVGSVDHNGIHQPAHHDAPFDYQIKTGDTLASIAIEQLGDEKRVPDIIALNPQLKDAKRLPIGTIIKLPATR